MVSSCYWPFWQIYETAAGGPRGLLGFVGAVIRGGALEKAWFYAVRPGAPQTIQNRIYIQRPPLVGFPLGACVKQSDGSLDLWHILDADHKEPVYDIRLTPHQGSTGTLVARVFKRGARTTLFWANDIGVVAWTNNRDMEMGFPTSISEMIRLFALNGRKTWCVLSAGAAAILGSAVLKKKYGIRGID